MSPKRSYAPPLSASRSVRERRRDVAAGLGISLVALALKGLFLEADIDTGLQFAIAAIALAAVLFGPFAGVTATITLMLGDDVLFEAPVGEFTLADAEDLAVILLFGLNGFLISGLSQLLIGQRRRAEERAAAVVDSEARFRSVFESHPSGLFVVDDNGIIRHTNAEAAAMFGYDPGELHGLRVDLLVPEALRDAHARHRRTYAGSPSARKMGGDLDLRGRRKDGREFPIDVALRSYVERGSRYTIAAAVDTTDQHVADQLRRRFIDVLSHELRTPVTTIYGTAQMLLRKRHSLDDEVSDDLIAGMAEQSERLHRMIENLLVVARVERGVELPGNDPVLLQRHLPRIVERERELWPAVDFTLDVPPDLPLVRADEASLSLLVGNLVANAAKYAGTAGPVEVRAARRNGRVEVAVADRGPGVDQTASQQLFALFYRGERTERLAPGSGIGLFVSKALADAMDASLGVSNRPGGGAVFTVRLRLYDLDDEDGDLPADPTRVGSLPA